MFGNALGNAAVGAINEAEWKAAQPRINQQAGSIVDSIMGDSSAASSGADQYARLWNASLFGDGTFGSAAGSAADSPASGNYDLIATSESPEGYPVPVTDTSDPAVLDALYKNTTAFVNYERSQGLYGDLPPVPQPWDSEGLIGYNHVLQGMVWPDSGVTMLAPVNVVAPSAMQQDIAAANAVQADTETALSSLQGSVGGDIAYSGLTLVTRGLLDLGVAAESVADIVTDRQSAEQVVTGLGRGLYGVATDIAHPIDTYNRAVGAVSDWYGEPLDQKAQDIGRFGIDTLLSFGAEGLATKGLGYIDTLADGFGSVVNGLGDEPMIGSLAAQRGAISLGGDLGETRISSLAGASAIDPLAAFRAANPISSRVLDAYQSFYNTGWARVEARAAAGVFDDVSPNLLRAIKGQEVDSFARGALRDALRPGGDLEDLAGLVRVNRRLYDMGGSGLYRVPDVYIPSENVILDGTIGVKTLGTPQVTDFFGFSNTQHVLVVKPDQVPLLIARPSGLIGY